MKSFFPDTNFFFECGKASELPWHKLDEGVPAPGPDILLIVPPTVLKEIDRHKAKGNSRTARRAREVSALLREALRSPDKRAVLRESNPRVVLELPPVVPVDFAKFPFLDSQRADHWIVAEYATMDMPGLSILTDDTLLALAVRSIGHEPVLIPDEFKLPVERDERDDKIAALHAELKTYKAAAPDISLNVLDTSGDITTELVANIVRYSPSKIELDSALQNVQVINPMRIDAEPPPAFSQTIGLVWKSATEQEIEDYKTRTYPEWLDATRKKIEQLPGLFNTIVREIHFGVSLMNGGFVNAEGLRIFIEGSDGILLLDSLSAKQQDKREKTLLLPKPIPAPTGGYRSLMSYMDSVRATRDDLSASVFTDLIPKPQHPNEFHYVSRKPSEAPFDRIELICSAFPHQQAARVLAFRAYVAENWGASPRLRIRVEATNLRNPIEKFVKFRISETAGDFLAKLNETVRRW
jgi:PIN domain